MSIFSHVILETGQLDYSIFNIHLISCTALILSHATAGLQYAKGEISCSRTVVALAARHVLDEAGANLVRGTIQAVANGISACQGEVLSLTRDVLVLQPPVRGTREVIY